MLKTIDSIAFTVIVALAGIKGGGGGRGRWQECGRVEGE